jgi:hypothetical protein
VEWFSKKGRRWMQGVKTRSGRILPWSYPPHPEFLIRPGGALQMREICAVLKLRRPYLAYVRICE